MYRFLGVGLMLVCRGDTGLRGGGRPLPAGDGLLVAVGDNSIGEAVPNAPEDSVFKIEEPTLGSPEIDNDLVRAEAPSELGGELGGEVISVGDV